MQNVKDVQDGWKTTCSFRSKCKGTTNDDVNWKKDVLIVDRALIPRDNQVVMVRLREKFMIRRLMAYDDGYTLLIADNLAFVVIEVTGEGEDFAIWGW